MINNAEMEPEKPKLNGINRITNGIGLQCKSPEDAKLLRTMHWNTTFEGLTISKPKCGIVIHRASAADLAPTFEDKDIIMFELCSHVGSAYDELSTYFKRAIVFSLLAMVSTFLVSLRKTKDMMAAIIKKWESQLGLPSLNPGPRCAWRIILSAR